MTEKTVSEKGGAQKGRKKASAKKKAERRVGLQEWFRKSWLAVLGVAKTISEESDKMLNRLVEKGQVSEAELKNAISGLRETIQGLREDVERRVKEIEEKVKELSASAPFSVEDFRKYVENIRSKVTKLWKQ